MKSNFWRFLILVSFVGGLAGCGSSSKKATQKSMDGSVFTRSIVPASLRTTHFDKSDCSRQLKPEKYSQWKNLVGLANSCVKAGQWPMVEAIGNRLAQIEQANPWGMYYLSLAAQQRKDYDRALWMIDLALKKSPQFGLFAYQKGRILWDMNNFSSAVSMFHQAIDADPNLIDAHLILGQVYFRDRELAKAGRHFEAVLLVEPNNVSAVAGLAELRLERNDIQPAIELLTRAINLAPDRLDIRLRLAFVYESKEKDLDQALNTYRRIKSLFQNGQLKGTLPFSLDEKIKALEVAIVKAEPGAQLSLREPAQNKKKVAK